MLTLHETDEGQFWENMSGPLNDINPRPKIWLIDIHNSVEMGKFRYKYSMYCVIVTSSKWLPPSNLDPK